MPPSEKQNNLSNQNLLFSTIAQHTAAAPDKIALVTAERSITRRQLTQKLEQVASALAERGLKRGEPCAIVAGNTIEHVLVMLGIARAGGVVAPMSLLLKGETLARLTEDARPRFIFTDQAGRECLDDRRPGAVEEVMLDNQSSFSRFLRTASVLPPMPNPNDRFSIIYSSGTTGVPKGIVHTHNARSLYGKVFAEEYGIGRDSVTLLTTALYSNASWMLLLPTLFAGATLVMPGKYRAENFGADVEKYRVTHAFLVPTQIDDLLALQSNEGGQVLPPVVISAGSHLLPALKQRILAQGDTRLFELYGNTEGAATLLRPGQMAQGLESVGSAISTGEIAILNDDEQLAEPGCEGEIIGRSPLMSEGYFRRDDLNAELFWRDSQGRLFVRTGDIGEINREGLLFLRGRKKDMLVSGGINVYPIDIETVLLSHPGISEAAVVGKAHPRWGETPHAFVVAAGAAQSDADKFKAWANQQLDKHQRLDGVTLIAALPRNALGKVVKDELQQRLAQERVGDR